MRYLLMICTDEEALLARSPEESAASMDEYAALMDAMSTRGNLLGAERLRPTSDATSVRVRDGEVLTSDGPFAETKEQMGGYFLVECDDLDQAIELASKIPTARDGVVEVRPVWDM